METLLESDNEEQVGGGETQGEEDEEEKRELKELEETLRNVQVSAPQQPLLRLKTDDLCPESYRANSPMELRMLAIADNFQLQYLHLYPERKPLLLCPFNECGVKKFVSTTLLPTPTSHLELFTWEGCASFVADFLSLEPLESAIDLPRYIFSSTSVLETRRATSFEFASLLCSLLLGANYSAYCVSGFAVREMCLLDQGPQQCPLLDTELKEQESEQRPADPLQGHRIHCWVLVLAGSRSVQENFFVDPLTGKSYATDDDNFLGIESVWDNLNYYVNMQDCSRGCAGLVYDLEDLNLWEPVLYGAKSKKQLILDVLKKKEESNIISDEGLHVLKEKEQPQVFQMPRSWVSSISISKKDLEDRFPEGTKVTCYRKAQLERFALYLRSDGLIARLTAYKDQNCTEVMTVKEWYQHRNDHLEERELNKVDNFTSERFKQGRRFHLLSYRFTDTERQMEFSSARVDNLLWRVESVGEMTETFEARSDFLHYRHVVYDQDPDVDADPEKRPLQKVVERFHRNRSKPANEDVAERVFLLAKRQIELTFHLEDRQFMPLKRCFLKPRESTETQKAGDFTGDMVSSSQCQADASEKPLETLTLYEILVDLMKDEEKVVQQIKVSQKEVRDIAACRQQEEGDVQLHFSMWTATGAIRARRQREKMERLAVEEQRWLQEKENDILAPFLIRLDNPETLSAEDAKRLHQDCLTEFKQRLVDHANLIQERYEEETRELQKKQQWYQENQLNMTLQQEEEYQTYCSEKTLQIYVAKKQLSMHKEAAPQKYRALDQKLLRDPRLSRHLLS